MSEWVKHSSGMRFEEGTVLALPVPPGPEMDMEYKIDFEVTFGEMEFAKGGQSYHFLKASQA